MGVRHNTDSHETRSCYTNLALFLSMKNNHHNAYSSDCSTAVFVGEKCKITNVQFLNSSSAVGVSDAPGGVVDANRMLLLRVGVGLLTAGGGPSGGVGRRGAGDVAAVARRLTLSSVSWPRFSGGGGGGGGGRGS